MRLELNDWNESEPEQADVLSEQWRWPGISTRVHIRPTADKLWFRKCWFGLKVNKNCVTPDLLWLAVTSTDLQRPHPMILFLHYTQSVSSHDQRLIRRDPRLSGSEQTRTIHRTEHHIIRMQVDEQKVIQPLHEWMKLQQHDFSSGPESQESFKGH